MQISLLLNLKGIMKFPLILIKYKMILKASEISEAFFITAFSKKFRTSIMDVFNFFHMYFVRNLKNSFFKSP